MSIIQILFFALSAFAIGSAIMVLVSKNPIHSVLWLILVFFAISGHYILLNAQFLAIVNIIVYAGAIMVLFLFVIMLINVKKDSEPQKQFLVKLLGVVAGGSFLTLLVALVKQTAQIQGRNLLMKDGVIGLIHPLGKALFNEYVVPFEISSVLFLSAMVGAVIIGKKCKISGGAIIGPNASIGNGCIISGGIIRDSIIMDNCEIGNNVN